MSFFLKKNFTFIEKSTVFSLPKAFKSGHTIVTHDQFF